MRHAGVLEVLNCLLSAGEVPGLFSSEELSKELAALDSKRDKDSHYQVCASWCWTLPVHVLMTVTTITVRHSICPRCCKHCAAQLVHFLPHAFSRPATTPTSQRACAVLTAQLVDFASCFPEAHGVQGPPSNNPYFAACLC